MITRDLFKKYDVPTPRYTSYPTVPYWSRTPSREEWMGSLKEALGGPHASWSLYMHIPFCETLCTFCGCNTVITKDHGREESYKNLLQTEWNLYLENVPAFRSARFRQLHLGGGTPTFLAPEVLKALIEPILNQVTVDETFEASVEVDPRRTSREHLKALRDLGFSRVSMGVQDFDSEVQRMVNRVQSVDVTAQLTNDARNLGYDSVNYDLIYGLPKQNIESFEATIEQAVRLKPDRIALYSFALVPWIKPAQRLFKDEDLPKGDEKRALYERGRHIFLQNGYLEIGMDHFALPGDGLVRAQQAGGLHRNFMGYTDSRTKVLLGLGVSAISETPSCFHQNEKVLPVYERQVLAGQVPTHRGHVLDELDRKRREQILNLMTRFEVELEDSNQEQDVREFLRPLLEDSLITVERGLLRILEPGRPFLRNACVAFDQHLRKNAPETAVFSRSI